MEQIKMIEDLTREELGKRILVLDPLCLWKKSEPITEKEKFMRRQQLKLLSVLS